MNKILKLAALALVCVCAVTGCGGKISNKSLNEILQKDSDYSHIDPVTINLVSEMSLGNGKTALFFSGKGKDKSEMIYYIGIMNDKTGDVAPLNITYTPLKLMNREILENRPQNMNVSYFEKVVERLKSAGEACFEDEAVSIEFLKEITGENGLISTSTAQNIIVEMAQKDFEFNYAEDFFAIFDDGTANPLCYASSDDNPAYEEKKVWLAYDIDGRSLGIYNSKADLYRKFTGEEVEFAEDEEAEAKVLTFATSAGNPPYSYLVDGQLAGAEVEIARAIAAKLGMELEIFNTSAADALSGTESGTYNMAMGTYTQSSDNGNVSFSDNYYGDYAIMLSNIHSSVSSDICVALSDLKADGTIAGIMDRYKDVKVTEEKPEEEAKKAEEKTPNQPAEKKEEGEIAYRVRKSANDSTTQMGAYAGLSAARRAADKHKNLGYKVYDTNGNLVYAP